MSINTMADGSPAPAAVVAHRKAQLAQFSGDGVTRMADAVRNAGGIVGAADVAIVAASIRTAGPATTYARVKASERSHAAPRQAPAARQTPEQTARRTAALQARIATLKARAARQKVHTARIDREARLDRGASGRRV